MFGQPDSFKLPGEWDKAFTISVANRSRGGSSSLLFTYDSCIYERPARQVMPRKWTFVLSRADKDEFLEKMRELKIETIRNGDTVPSIQVDGWFAILCMGGYCIEGGSATQMSDKDKEVFLAACKYLREFAEKKIKSD